MNSLENPLTIRDLSVKMWRVKYADYVEVFVMARTRLEAAEIALYAMNVGECESDTLQYVEAA